MKKTKLSETTQYRLFLLTLVTTLILIFSYIAQIDKKIKLHEEHRDQLETNLEDLRDSHLRLCKMPRFRCYWSNDMSILHVGKRPS